MSQDGRARSRLRNAREETLAILEMRHAGSRIDSAEYERRVFLAGRASTIEELQALLVDRDPAPARAQSALPPAPSVPPAPASPPAPAAVPAVSTYAPAPVEAGEDHGFVFALLGGAARKGRWDPPARLTVSTLMGGADLDFREARLLDGVTEVSILAIMGGVNIVVPPDLDVEVDGIGLLGGFPHLSRRSDDVDAPLLRIKGLALMGGVGVKVKK